MLQLNGNYNGALCTGGGIPTKQHTHPDVPPQGLETGQQEAGRAQHTEGPILLLGASL